MRGVLHAARDCWQASCAPRGRPAAAGGAAADMTWAAHRREAGRRSGSRGAKGDVTDAEATYHLLLTQVARWLLAPSPTMFRPPSPPVTTAVRSEPVCRVARSRACTHSRPRFASPRAGAPILWLRPLVHRRIHVPCRCPAYCAAARLAPRGVLSVSVRPASGVLVLRRAGAPTFWGFSDGLKGRFPPVPRPLSVAETTFFAVTADITYTTLRATSPDRHRSPPPIGREGPRHSIHTRNAP